VRSKDEQDELDIGLEITAMRKALRAAARPAVYSGLLVTALVVGCAISVMASDPPHWLGATETTDCTTPCHKGHHADGGQLTSDASNVNLCQSCHSSNNLPIDSAHQANPGVTGTTHAFGVSTTNSTYGAQPPQDAAMSVRTPGDKVVCSTCHNQHAASSANHGTPRISDANKVVSDGGTGSVTSGGTFTGPEGVWYLVEITSVVLDSETLQYSKDNAGTWFGPVAFSYDTPVALGADGVEVTVTSGVKATERWEFYATYPFLRIPLDSGDNTSVEKYCRDCHRAWVMDHTSSGGNVNDYDGNYKSHPVGVQLNANGGNYDRTVPLDGDGQPLTGGADADGNVTNDLRLDSSGYVQCLSCHSVHYADSNTLSVDAP
jgi:nitrate/TMAO reductase-like tetraheme cytochrome c subunit